MLCASLRVILVEFPMGAGNVYLVPQSVSPVRGPVNRTGCRGVGEITRPGGGFAGACPLAIGFQRQSRSNRASTFTCSSGINSPPLVPWAAPANEPDTRWSYGVSGRANSATTSRTSRTALVSGAQWLIFGFPSRDISLTAASFT